MFLLVPVVLLVVPGCCGLWTVDRLMVRTNSSVTVPCHYNYRFKEQVKFWCRGKNWYTCITVRESRRVNITDSPAELVTTLTLSGLQVRDSGRYWCAIKRGGLLRADIRTSLELQVTDDKPDLWVRSDSVFGTEGGNVSVDCFYSDRLKEEEKKWCRSGDLHSCQSQQDTQATQHAKLQLQDDGQGVFTVTLTDLQREDGGWFWCTAGGVQALIHITVTTATTTHNYTTTTSSTTQNHTVFPERTSSLHNLSPTTSTHTPPSSTHTPPSLTQTPAVLSTMTRHSSDRTSITLPVTAQTKHDGDSVTHTCTTDRLYVYVLVSVGVLLGAVVTAVLFRRWTWTRNNHMILKEVEPNELSVKDDIELLNHEWTSRTVLQVEE